MKPNNSSLYQACKFENLVHETSKTTFIRFSLIQFKYFKLYLFQQTYKYVDFNIKVYILSDKQNSYCM